MSLTTKTKHLTGATSLRSFSRLFHLKRRHSLPPAGSGPPLHQDPHSLLKEDPIEVLSNLWAKTFSQPGKPFSNLAGFLSKLDLWVLAYQRTCAHFTGSFPPRNAIHTRVLSDLLSLRNAVVSGDFIWNDKARPVIRGPNERPVSALSRRQLDSLLTSKAPPFQDQEPPYRDSDNQEQLRGLSLVLERASACIRARDEQEEQKMDKKKMKKLKTKKRILKANEPKPDPYWLRTFYDFSPEEAAKIPNYGYCGILSPLLANVCLNELDRMMEEKIAEFFRPCEHDTIWRHSIDDGCHNPSWPEFVPSRGKGRTKKMDYIRFGGHFLIGIRGSRQDAVGIRKGIIDFCENEYGIRLDNSKIEIEHVSRGVQFLDHIICRRVIYPTLRYTASGGAVVSQKGVGTLLSVTASLQQCIRQFRRLRLVKGDKDPEPLPCTPMLYSGQAHTNAQMNKLLETLADWYMFADNRRKVVGFCAYVVRSSLAKLYAARYRLKSRAKVYGIASRDLSRSLREHTNNSAPEYSDLLRMGLVDTIEGVQFSRMSFIPPCDYTPFPRKWAPHHERVLKEYARLQDPKFFCELLKSVKRRSLSLPQDEVSGIVWDYKTLGVQSSRFIGIEGKVL
ncbi:unnamed protein product [Cuscuta campestris]|uniref:Domain X domain-containing protein n=1 Tax=Cuscuta campestris TaxID=132261 RepID=A0A484NPJ5_9ASTE|nr:unnamed protein product [Cuscuta campestris]